mmetsp:Transcript_47595/g.151903  ORF Transcript_47595/g.151903 Transcript_47595/m.151903 type:complete len:337 (-) Transcript_47595:13-1023(-)
MLWLRFRQCSRGEVCSASTACNDGAKVFCGRWDDGGGTLAPKGSNWPFAHTGPWVCSLRDFAGLACRSPALPMSGTAIVPWAPVATSSSAMGRAATGNSRCPAKKARRSWAALATASRKPSTTTFPSSWSNVTPWLCARACNAGGGTGLQRLRGKISSSHSAVKVSMSWLASTAPSLGPKSRTSQRERSMCTRQPVVSWMPATLLGTSGPIMRVRMSSAQTAVLTAFRGPPRLSNCLRTACTAASEPATWSNPRTLSSFIRAWQLTWMSRSRRRLRRLRVPRSSASSAISTTHSFWPVASMPKSSPSGTRGTIAPEPVQNIGAGGQGWVGCAKRLG